MRQPPRYLTVTDCLIYGHADLYLDLEGRETMNKTKRMWTELNGQADSDADR